MILLLLFIKKKKKNSNNIFKLGGSNFIILSILSLVLSNNKDDRKYLISCLVIVWGIRLTVFLFSRILTWGHDNRFDEMRSNFFKFAGFWTI